MAVPRLDIRRRNRGERTLVTLAGDIGPATTPLLRAAVERCLLDGVTVIDIDLATVGSCDAGGLDVLLSASRRACRVHARLRLLHPCAQITRLLDATGSASLLPTAPSGPVPPTASGDLMSTAAWAPDDLARRQDQPALKDGIRLRRLTRRQAEDMREDIADLAAESVAGTAGEAYHDRGDFLHRIAVTARRPGFALLVAETTVLVGCAFGFPRAVTAPAAGSATERSRRSSSGSPPTHGSSSSPRWWPTRTVSSGTSPAACSSVCSPTCTPPSGSPCCTPATGRDRPPSRPGAGRTWARSSGCPAPSTPAC